jgi:hypothetical protein
VVRGHEIDLTVEHVLPQPLARRRVADRRCALERRPDTVDVFRAEEQVMRTRLDRDIRATLARANDRCHRGGARRMHDMDARPGLPSGLREALDGPPFRSRRPRLEPRSAVAAIHRVELLGALRDERLILGVDGDEMSGDGRRRERGRERFGIEVSELRNAAGTQEGLEAHDP